MAAGKRYVTTSIHEGGNALSTSLQCHKSNPAIVDEVEYVIAESPALGSQP